MKKTLLLTITTFLLVITAYAQKSQGIKWNESNFEEILAKAKKSSKPIFMDCYTAWCGPCKYMANTIFVKKEAGDFFNKNFINVKVDMEKGEGIELQKRYKVSVFPTFLVLDENGVEMGRVVGAADILPFIEKVKAAMNPEGSISAKKAKYEKSKKNDDAITYLEALKDAYIHNDIATFINKNYSNFGYALYREDFWPYVSIALASEDVCEKVLADKFNFDNGLGKGAVDAKIAETFLDIITNYLMNKDTLSKEQVAQYAKDIALLSPANSRYAEFISKIAVAHSINDTAAIDELLNANYIYRRLTGNDSYMAERVLFKSDILSGAKKDEYLKAKAKYYSSLLNGIESSISK